FVEAAAALRAGAGPGREPGNQERERGDRVNARAVERMEQPQAHRLPSKILNAFAPAVPSNIEVRRWACGCCSSGGTAALSGKCSRRRVLILPRTPPAVPRPPARYSKLTGAVRASPQVAADLSKRRCSRNVPFSARTGRRLGGKEGGASR